MHRKRVGFDEIEIPIPKGHEKIVDRDETTEYLFINGPKRIYTVYFDSAMPFYSGKVLSCYPEGSTLELKLPDRKIVFFCPSRGEARKDGLWYFNIEFDPDGEERLILPGQVVLNYDEVYRRSSCGRLPFVDILAKIRLVCKKECPDAAIAV